MKYVSERPSENDEVIPELPEELGLTDVTDVICVGSGPGALAYAIACAELGLEVMMVNSADPAELTDELTLDYLQSMVEDLDIAETPNAQLASVCAQPYSRPADRKTRLDPFVGHELRSWSTECASSVFGFMCTSVPDAVLTEYRTDSDRPIEAAVVGRFEPVGDRPAGELGEWLLSKVDELDLDSADGHTLERLIFHDGRVVGAAVRTPSGTELTRAIQGLVFSHPISETCDWPVQSELSATSRQIGLVSRRAGRFGRVVILDEP